MTDDSNGGDERCRVSPALVAEITARYGLDRPSQWQDLGGSRTTNLRLDLPGRPVVARIHQRSTTADRVAAIQAARRVVAAAGVPTVLPLPAPDGASMITVAGGWLVELEPYVSWNRRMNTPELLRPGFGLLARVHDALRDAALPAAAGSATYANHLAADRAVERTRVGAARIRGWQEPALTEYADRVVRHVEVVAEAEAELAGDQLVQAVHGDFWDNNVLFCDERPVAVIDFDFMAVRPRVDDLALTIWFLLLEPGHGLPDAATRELVRDLLDRYDAHAAVPLSADERRALPLAVARQPAWSVGRWIPVLDEARARDHARSAADEFPVAAAVLDDLAAWQATLTGRVNG